MNIDGVSLIGMIFWKKKAASWRRESGKWMLLLNYERMGCEENGSDTLHDIT